jgi:two-component system, NtrC family, response regulator HydG
MAGSHSNQTSPFNDPILTARLEAIRQLAGGLSDRVAVMDRNFNLIYANEAAWVDGKAGTHDLEQAKCYEAFVRRSAPCDNCPAIKVFQTPDIQSVSCSNENDGTACGMQQAFPLVGGDGQVASMLVLFKMPARSSRFPDTQVPEETAPSIAQEQLGDLIGGSAAMQQLFEMIGLVADCSATVLIQGESGTGKELVAKTIHQLSHRREKPFVVVDCGSLPETLLESELFGHVKGSFPGP